jgi:hypothetical protein
MRYSTTKLFMLLFFAFFLLNCTQQDNEKNTVSIHSTIDFGSKSFNHYAPLPVNGKHKGVIVMGCSGFDAFVIEMDKNKNWKQKEALFGKSFMLENQLTKEMLEETMVKYLGKMANYGIDKSDIFLVMSSVISADKDRENLLTKTANQFGITAHTVNYTDEARFAYISMMPKEYEDKAFVIDLGSGNTKISWVENGTIKTLETHGSKYQQKKIDHETVYREVTEIISLIPENLTKNCFVIGGAPYELAKQNEEYTDRYTVLNPLETYHSKDEKVIGGLNILNAIALTKNTRNFIFDWESNFGIGFVLSQSY